MAERADQEGARGGRGGDEGPRGDAEHTEPRAPEGPGEARERDPASERREVRADPLPAAPEDAPATVGEDGVAVALPPKPRQRHVAANVPQYRNEDVLRAIVDAGEDPRSYPYDRPLRGFVVPSWPVAEPPDNRRSNLPHAFVRRFPTEPPPEDVRPFRDRGLLEKYEHDPEEAKIKRKWIKANKDYLERNNEAMSEEHKRLVELETRPEVLDRQLGEQLRQVDMAVAGLASMMGEGDEEKSEEERRLERQAAIAVLTRKEAINRLSVYGPDGMYRPERPIEEMDTNELIVHTARAGAEVLVTVASSVVRAVVPPRALEFCRNVARNLMPDSEAEREKNSMLRDLGLVRPVVKEVEETVVNEDGEESVVVREVRTDPLAPRESVLGRAVETASFAYQVLFGELPADTPVSMWRVSQAMRDEVEETFSWKSELLSTSRGQGGRASLDGPLEQKPFMTMHELLSYEGLLTSMGAFWLFGLVSGASLGALHGFSVAKKNRFKSRRLRMNTVLNEASRASARFGNKTVWVPAVAYVAYKLRPPFVKDDWTGAAWFAGAYSLVFARRRHRLPLAALLTASLLLERSAFAHKHKAIDPYDNRMKFPGAHEF